MTREEMLKFCSVCRNRKMDLKRGLVCSLTDNYADFDPVCENYSQDIEEKHRKTVEKEVDKKEREKEIIWRIIPIVLYFIFLCCLLIPSSSTPIYILVILNVAVIAAIIAANILSWRKLKKKRSSDKELTIDKIMDCIRKEGYYPQKEDENYVIFKIQGEPFEIYFDAGISYFQLYKIYVIDKNLIPSAVRAALEVMKKFQLIKIYPYQRDEVNFLKFSIESNVLSFSDFDTFLPRYLQILFNSIDDHREYFKTIYEKQDENNTPKQKIGFPVNSSSIKN